MTTDRRAAVPASPHTLEKELLRHAAGWERRASSPCDGASLTAALMRKAADELASERSRRLQVEQERDALRKDVAYHSECRPNRRQAEEAIARAEAAERERDALQAKLDQLPILATVQRNAELEAQIETLREKLQAAHQQIMNLRRGYVGDLNREEMRLYNEGHKDARHAAAEIVAALAAVENGTER